MLRVIAPAKVNLHLAVGHVRPDGYHAVTTVLHALELHDVVTITSADELSVTCDVDLDCATAADNLAYRAAVAAAEAFDREPHVSIRLEKWIPHGAGLGGGSSDAAAVVAGLAVLWGYDIGDSRARQAATSLGADVPFFLESSGCALMSGRGDVTERLLPGFKDTPIVLVKPLAPVSTAAAYKAFDRAPMSPRDPTAMVDAILAADVGGLALHVENNMTDAATTVTPDVATVLRWFGEADGVTGCAIAGSGSAVFGVCDDHDRAERIAQSAVRQGWWASATALRPRGVEVLEGEGL